MLFQRTVVCKTYANVNVTLYVLQCIIRRECANMCHLNIMCVCATSRLSSRKKHEQTDIYLTLSYEENSGSVMNISLANRCLDCMSLLSTDVWTAFHL